MKLKKILVAALMLLISACAPRYDVEEVPILGGTVEQRAAVTEALGDFERWIGSGRIQLSKVVLDGPALDKKEAQGFYGTQFDSILLDDELPLRRLKMMLRHELCHAVEHQEHLLNKPVAAFDDAAAAILQDRSHPLHSKLMDARTDGILRKEMFSYVCQRAPVGTALHAHPCPSESSDYIKMAKWIASNIWTGDPDVSTEATFRISPSIIEWAAPASVDRIGFFGSETDAVLILLPKVVGEASEMNVVSALDGTELPPETWIPDPEPIILGYEGRPPVGASVLNDYYGALTGIDDVLAVSDGDTTIRVVTNVLGSHGAFGSRVIAGSGDRWSVVDGACPSDVHSVFLANNKLYVGWAEGADVLWAQAE